MSWRAPPSNRSDAGGVEFLRSSGGCLRSHRGHDIVHLPARLGPDVVALLDPLIMDRTDGYGGAPARRHAGHLGGQDVAGLARGRRAQWRLPKM
jgi:hypothetical protein